MKPLILILLFILIAVQHSCKKPDNIYSNAEDFEIKVINDNTITSYKFDLKGYPLLFSALSWHCTYKYDQNLPIEREFVINNDSIRLNDRSTYKYNKTNRILVSTTNAVFGDSITVFTLNEDLSVANSISNNDTSFYYYNTNGRLDAIEHGLPFWSEDSLSTRIVDSLIYDDYNNLIEVKSLSPFSKIKFNYDSKNRLTEVLHFDNPTAVYTYTDDDKLLTVNGHKVIQKNNFVPINLQPVNYYRFRYLKRPWIH